MRRIALILMVAAVMAMMAVSAAPGVAIAQEEKKKEEEKAKEEKDKAKEEKDKAKEEKEKDLPKSGGLSSGDVAFLVAGAGALIIGGGLLVRRIVRNEQH